MLSGMLFHAVEGNLHVAAYRSELPAKTATGKTGFQAAIPEQRPGGVCGGWIFHYGNRLRPQLLGVAGSAITNQGIEKGNDIAERNFWVESNEAIPNHLRRVQITRARENVQNRNIRLRGRRHDFVQDDVGVGLDLQGSRKAFRCSLRIKFQGLVKLCEGRILFARTQQEVAKTPGHVGRLRINSLGRNQCGTGLSGIAFTVVGNREIQHEAESKYRSTTAQEYTRRWAFSGVRMRSTLIR